MINLTLLFPVLWHRADVTRLLLTAKFNATNVLELKRPRWNVAPLTVTALWVNSFNFCPSLGSFIYSYKGTSFTCTIFTRFFKSLPIVIQPRVQAKSLCKPIKGDLALKKTLPLPRFKLTTYWLTCNLYHNDHLPITFCSRPSWPLKDCRFSVGPCCGLQQADEAMARPFPVPMRHFRLLFTSVNFFQICSKCLAISCCQVLNKLELWMLESYLKIKNALSGQIRIVICCGWFHCYVKFKKFPIFCNATVQHMQ